MRRRNSRGQPYSLSAMVIQRWLTTPGPCKSANTVVSPGIGRLLSSFELQSGLLDDDRCAVKSLGSVRRNGSEIRKAVGWTQPVLATSSADAADRVRMKF